MRKINLHLKGGRYDAVNGVPTESLPALAAFGALVRSVAKDLFYHRNPDRERLSPGFDKAFMPAIVRIEGGGSADADFVGWGQFDNDDWHDLYDDAQDEVMALLEKSGGNVVAFPGYLSLRSKRQLAEALRLVTEDETLEATPIDDEASGRGKVVRLDAYARDRVVAVVEASQATSEEPFSIAGRVKGVQREPWVIQLYYREGNRILNVPVTDQVRDAAMRDLVDDVNVLVWLSGSASRDEEGRRTFECANKIRRVAGPSISKRLEVLQDLQDGWVDEEPRSRAPTKRMLRWVEQQVWDMIEEIGCDRPYLFAMPDGGVEALWKVGSQRTVVRFSASDKRVQGLAMRDRQKQVERYEGDHPDEAFRAWARSYLVVLP
jgi:hypothetical protein